MKKEKARLADLASKMKRPAGQASEERSKTSIRKADLGNTIIEANPPHGEKGVFRKITVTLPPQAYELLVRESARRKIAGESNHLISSLIREAVVKHLSGVGK